MEVFIVILAFAVGAIIGGLIAYNEYAKCPHDWNLDKEYDSLNASGKVLAHVKFYECNKCHEVKKVIFE